MNNKSQREIVIRPVSLPDLSNPHPYRIAADGTIGDQEFWKGRPIALNGFQDRLDVKTVNVHVEDFMENPEQAIGRYAVFVNEHGGPWVLDPAIDSVEILPAAQ